MIVLEEEAPSPTNPDGKYRVLYATEANHLIKVLDQVEYPSSAEVELLFQHAQKSRRGGPKAPMRLGAVKFGINGGPPDPPSPICGLAPPGSHGRRRRVVGSLCRRLRN